MNPVKVGNKYLFRGGNRDGEIHEIISIRRKWMTVREIRPDGLDPDNCNNIYTTEVAFYLERTPIESEGTLDTPHRGVIQ